MSTCWSWDKDHDIVVQLVHVVDAVCVSTFFDWISKYHQDKSHMWYQGTHWEPCQ